MIRQIPVAAAWLACLLMASGAAGAPHEHGHEGPKKGAPGMPGMHEHGAPMAPAGKGAVAHQGKVVILKPRNGAVVRGRIAKVEFDIPERGPRGSHVHVYVDGRMRAMVRSGRRYVVSGLQAGRHRIELRLVDKNHNELGPRDSVEIRVVKRGAKKKGGGRPAHAAKPDAEMRIVHGKPAGGRRTVRVKQGATVRLRFTSDAEAEIHLHGYDIETTLEPGVPFDMKVEARAAGRFPLTLHASEGHGHDDEHGDEHGHGHGHGHGGGEVTLMYLEVYP